MQRIKGNSRQITDSDEIAEILNIAKTHQWPLGYSVHSGVRRVSQNTEISAVDAKRQTITVGSEVKYSDISPTAKITFRAQSGGITIRFESHLIEVGGNALSNRLFTECRIVFPKVLVYTQLRRAIRVNCIDLDHIPVTFFGEDGRKLEGDVADLSATGTKVKFKGDIANYFETSRSVSDCQLRLPDGATVEARVKILGIIRDANNDVSFVRCYFLKLKEDHELKLEELISKTLRKLDRESQT